MSKPDSSQPRALITGGNSGIGYEMARELARRGFAVSIAARNAQRSAECVARIQAETPGAQVEALALDLGDWPGVDAFADAWLARRGRLDVLALNAGLYTMGLGRLANGYERMMGIMHFGHFRLSQRLVPAMVARGQGRVIVTSSLMHRFGRINPASYQHPWRLLLPPLGYAQAKLANLLFTRHLSRRLYGTGVTVNAFHPGMVATGIYRELPAIARSPALRVMLSAQQGADTGIWLATAPELAAHSGDYYVERRVQPGSRTSRDPQLARALWDYSERVFADAAEGRGRTNI